MPSFLRHLKLITVLLCFAMADSDLDAQSLINWEAPKSSTDVSGINIEAGAQFIYALNGGSSSINIAGINFQGSDFTTDSLPSGISFSPTGESSGRSPRAGTASQGTISPSTGNADYDELLGSIAYSNGTPEGIESGEMVFGNLTDGEEYVIQVWYNDQRYSRTMIFGDGSSNSTVNLGGGTPAYGQNVIGHFTASGTSQTLSMETNGFRNLHFNAITLQTASDVPGLGPISGSQWDIDSQLQWLQAGGNTPSHVISDGTAGATSSNAVFESVVQQFVEKQKFENLTFKQTLAWVGDQWVGQGNLGPRSEPDAPVVLAIGDNDYWYFNRNSGSGREYHGWHSTDMVNWTNVGNVLGTDGTNPNGAPEYEWCTTAEFKPGVDGQPDQLLFYYDSPNDHDPHVMSIDLHGPGQLDMNSRVYHGQVLQDADGNDIQTPGSDMAMFRNLDGTYHMVHEDWRAINAREHSWDSQIAGHSSSPDGINGFVYEEHPPLFDERGAPVLDNNGDPTFGQATHPNRNFTYEIVENLDAWGDYELLRVGDTYYLFADDHPEGDQIGLGYWYSDDLDAPFTYGGKIKDGFHPDPGVMFAEGKFQMFVQGSDDFSSTGPWVEGVEAQAGVDTDGDGIVDEWTEYQTIEESYFHIEDFAKVYGVNDAVLDLSSLPEGYGLQFRFRSSNPQAVFDRISLSATAAAVFLLGDVNQDGVVNFLDISPFIEILSASGFQDEADINQDGAVNFLDIGPFIGLLSS